MEERMSNWNQRIPENQGRESKRIIQLGGVVHIYAGKTPRQQWRMGKVEKLLRGRDNVVHAAEVVTVDNSLRRIRMKRPIQKLYPLEVYESAEVTPPAGATQIARDMSLQMVRDEGIPTVASAQ